MRDGVSDVHVVEWDRATLAACADEVLDVYAEAMEVSRLLAAGRRSILAGHLDRDGLRAVAARESGGRLVGIAYGHVGDRGQWWHDQVRSALERELGAEPRRALGARARSRSASCTCGRPSRAPGSAGSCSTGCSPARPRRSRCSPPPTPRPGRAGFYRAGGWVDLVRRLRFPGDPRDFAVLGLRLDGDR